MDPDVLKLPSFQNLGGYVSLSIDLDLDPKDVSKRENEGQEGLYFRMITAKVCPEGGVKVEAGQGSQITSPSLVLSCNALLCALCDMLLYPSR